jgi:thioredoxin 1
MVDIQKSKYIILDDINKWNELYESDNLIVAYFTASWCGPCRLIAPVFESLQNKYQNIFFIKIDVDDMDELSFHMEISCMPTFIFLKNKEKKYILEGANEEKLHELVSMFNESKSSKNQEIDESSEEITHLNSSTIDDDII